MLTSSKARSYVFLFVTASCMPFSPPDSPVGHPEIWDLLLLYSIDKPRCGYSLSIFLLPFETNVGLSKILDNKLRRGKPAEGPHR